MIVVSDTTPLNYLILIDQADILRRLYKRVIIPLAVHNELKNPRTPQKVRNWTKHQPEWLEMRTVQALNLSLGLGAGERETIALGLELKADLLLMDDIKARRAALEYGQNVTGTLGVLAVATKKG